MTETGYHHRRYTLAGILLSTGAPVGLLLLRTLVVPLSSVASIGADIASNWLVYAYVSVTTVIAFALFGYVLGRQADKLQYQSTTDVLTGLHNRRWLVGHLRQEYHRSRRYLTSLSLLLADVDQLKGINDVLGHAAGDRVLRDIADAIRMELRESDAGGRWGGDEFLIIAPSTEGAAALALAERLRVRLNLLGTAAQAATTVSVGVATSDPRDRSADDSEALVAKADAALHRAKVAGRNQVKCA